MMATESDEKLQDQCTLQDVETLLIHVPPPANSDQEKAFEGAITLTQHKQLPTRQT